MPIYSFLASEAGEDVAGKSALGSSDSAEGERRNLIKQLRAASSWSFVTSSPQRKVHIFWHMHVHTLPCVWVEGVQNGQPLTLRQCDEYLEDARSHIACLLQIFAYSKRCQGCSDWFGSCDSFGWCLACSQWDRFEKPPSSGFPVASCSQQVFSATFACDVFVSDH